MGRHMLAPHLVVLLGVAALAAAQNGTVDVPPLLDITGEWSGATATYPWSGVTANAGSSRGSACGYGNAFQDGFGSFRASASVKLFKGGELCGACFEVKCNSGLQPKVCKKGVSATLTVTDQCFPSLLKGPKDPCSPSARHFVLPPDIYMYIAKGGGQLLSLPILFRRVQCKRTGSITFQVNGSPGQLQVNIRNVAGAGTIVKAWIKADGTHTWTEMRRSWGENWIITGEFEKKALSFKVAAGDNTEVVADSVVPKVWTFGGIYSGGQFSVSKA